MKEEIERIRQQAIEAKKQKETDEANRAKQAADSSKKGIREEMETGHERLGKLELREAEFSAEAARLNHEIIYAEQRILQIEKMDRPNLEKDTDFEGEEELRAQALALLDKEKEDLVAALAVKREQVTDLRKEWREIGKEIEQILNKAEAYIGEKEIPQGKMEDIWRFIEQERSRNETVNGYRRHFSEREAGMYTFMVISGKAPDNKISAEYKDRETYLWGTPIKAFSDPRILNASLTGFEEGLNKIIKEKTLTGLDRNLTDEEMEKVRTGEFKLKYGNKELLVYSGGAPVPRQAEPQHLLSAELSENEKKIVAEAVNSWEGLDNLKKRLRLSEYREDVQDEILAEAKTENEEYNEKALKEKLPEVDVKLEAAKVELAKHQSEYEKLDEISRKLPEVNRLLDHIRGYHEGIEHYQQRIEENKKKKIESQTQRDALPKTVFRGKPKDAALDRDLAGRIKNYEEGIKNCEEYIAGNRAKISELEEKLAPISARIDALEPGFMEKWKALPQDRYSSAELNFHHRVSDAQSRLWGSNRDAGKLKWTKAQWEDKKYITLSLEEMLAKAPGR